MVGVAQLVERRVVVADVAGSSPVVHPSWRNEGLAPSGARRFSVGASVRLPGRPSYDCRGRLVGHHVGRRPVHSWDLAHAALLVVRERLHHLGLGAVSYTHLTL